MDTDVDSSDESAEADEISNCPTDNTFDPAVTTAHSYLGNDLEVVHGRTLLDNGICLNLPILFEVAVILFPDQTLPMVQYSLDRVNMLRSCVDKDRTFGVVHGGTKKKIDIGTTAEIYEYSDNHPDGFRIKARGRQRFKILKTRSSYGQIFADVKILPEINLGPPFFEERLASLDRLRRIPRNSKEARDQEYRVARRDSIVSPWPSWVYRQYDARRLAMRIRKRLRFIESRCTNIPEDPAELSFWLPQNLFMNDTAKIALLKFDCAIPRLQYEAQILSMLGRKVFVCSTCRRLIGKYSDIVSMNKEGLQAAYCNPVGAIHETLTLYKATNIILDQEPPTTACSWFPGYAWTIAYCAGCRFHVGWNFVAVEEALKPRTFWGLTRNNLILKRQTGMRRQIGARTDQTNSSSLTSVEDNNSFEEPVNYNLSSESEEYDEEEDDGDDDSQRLSNYRVQMP